MPLANPTPLSKIPTLPNVDHLPAMLDLPTAAELLGISRATIYRLAAKDDLPVPVVTVGNSRRIPTAPLLTLLGLTPAPGARTAADSADDTAGHPDTTAPSGAGPDGRGTGSDQDARPVPLRGPGPTSADGQTPTR
jgi:excisionase family DNA binding protein